MVTTEFLSTINIFSTLDAERLQYLADNLMVLDKKDNDVVFKKGAPGNAVYFIQEGTVKITTQALNGDELTLAVFHKGDFFGELTLFDNTIRTANAIACGRVTLLVMPRNNFINFMKENSDVAIGMLTVIGKRLRDTNEIMEMQTTRNVNDEMEINLNRGERVAQTISGFLGSWKYLLWFAFAMSAWLLINIYAIFIRPVDPYPFIFLNLVFSCLAAVQAPIIMMNQARNEKMGRITADLDYRVNIKSELQTQEIRMRLDKLNDNEQTLHQEIRHDQSEIIKNQNMILEKLNHLKGRAGF